LTWSSGAEQGGSTRMNGLCNAIRKVAPGALG
jgi:hypothetical protein